ncbi:factor associated with metabolism and energy [Trichechus manatus latirostris]|uniref:Factor associated with metabolism and energy n=1 Tax=Trichechus manatus latirostris TaxID=127582 RepID=A0A2Y9QK98_TRIMA|nr:factor associated with metabolism and energy [Trichechus manatus latirostris]
MGLGHSKAHPRVTKVAPLQNKGEETPSTCPVDFAFSQNLEEKSLYSFATLQDRTKALEGQLPPLRETGYGKYSAVPRAMYFDIPLEKGETSIIKNHPPRRLQKLEPIDLPQVITSERLLSQQEAGTTHKAKELEKKMQIPTYISGKRQYLHKMQMLEMNRKRQEVNIREIKCVMFTKFATHNPSCEAALCDFQKEEEIIINAYKGNSWNAEFLGHQGRNDSCPRKICKMETWLCEQETQGQLFWDGSSSDSDESGKDEKKPRALVRTKTERIPLFDEFFDRE